MTLIGVIALILHYFAEFDSSGGRLSQWLKRDLFDSVHDCAHPVIFWPKLSHAAVARSLCDSWAAC